MFVRHPASFFRSAKSYHLEGQEEWAKKNSSKILNDNSLTEALRACKDSDDRLIVSMKYWGIERQELQNMVENIEILKKINKQFFIIKCEDLWKNNIKENTTSFRGLISHDGFDYPLNNLLSIANNTSIHGKKKHPTNEIFKENFYGYGEKALDFYNKNFKSLESRLGYN